MAMNVAELHDRRTALMEGETDPQRRPAWEKILDEYKALAGKLRDGRLYSLRNTTIDNQLKQGRHMAAYVVRRFLSHGTDPKTPKDEAELSLYAAQRLSEINREAQELIPGTHGVTKTRTPGGYGEHFTQLREQQEKTQSEVAVARGSTPQNVSDLEQEKQGNPELSNIARHLVLGLGISPTDAASTQLAHDLLAITDAPADTIPTREQLDEYLRRLESVLPDGQRSLGNYLKYLREIGGMSPKQIYEQVGIQKSFFGKCESGVKVPSLFTFLDWMQALGYCTEDIEFYAAWVIALKQESQRDNLRRTHS